MVRCPAFEGLCERLDELGVDVWIQFQDGWMWDAGHVDPVVGLVVVPAWFFFCPVTVGGYFMDVWVAVCR